MYGNPTVVFKIEFLSGDYGIGTVDCMINLVLSTRNLVVSLHTAAYSGILRSGDKWNATRARALARVRHDTHTDG